MKLPSKKVSVLSTIATAVLVLAGYGGYKTVASPSAKPLTAEIASGLKAGQEIDVQYTVQGGITLDKGKAKGMRLLNDDANYEQSTLTVVLPANVLPGDVSQFLGRTYRLRGKVSFYKDSKTPQVKVASAEQFAPLK